MDSISFIKIKQHFNNNSLDSIKDELSEELLRLGPLIRPGANVAIAVGSRGIKNLALVVREIAEFIRANNAHPFIVPAMGSHGNATAEGQSEVLASYGISEDNIGVPVRSSMEVVELPRGSSPLPVYIDKNVFHSDGVILVNRIKPHTDFHAKYESGLVKMSVIGLGKEKQALAVHQYGVYGLSSLIPLVAQQIYSSGKILGGIALVENAYDETMIIKALKTDDFFEQEPILLDIAVKNMPSLPVRDLDVLIIDKIGKDISGVGIDSNITGRIKIVGQEEPEEPIIKAIALLDLTEASHGNAYGIGLSNVITKRLFDKIDFESTYKNAVTSSFLERAKVPVVARNDKEAFEFALRSCAYIKKGEEKIIRIKDTLHLDEIYVSQAVFNLIKDSKGIKVIKEDELQFSSANEIKPF